MRSAGGVIALLVVAVIGGYLYKLEFAQGSTAATTTPAQIIDIVGVKNDLIAIAQSERAYQAQHGSYAPIDDLVSSGEMTMKKSGRDGYTYEVETSAGAFQVVAHCPAATSPGCTNYSIDQNMAVQSAP